MGPEFREDIEEWVKGGQLVALPGASTSLDDGVPVLTSADYFDEPGVLELEGEAEVRQNQKTSPGPCGPGPSQPGHGAGRVISNNVVISSAIHRLCTISIEYSMTIVVTQQIMIIIA